MSGIVVTKSSPVLVVPSSDSSPAAGSDTDTITLSSFDKWMGPVSVTALLAYDRPIHKPAETIKKALAQALAYYRPLAGRLVTGADGKSCLSCTGEGVTFVAASACSALDLDVVATSAALQKDLAVYYYPDPDEVSHDADPLLQVQVTEFSCGGFILGVTSNHVATDGVGMAQFLQAVGELARGVSPPSVVPVRHWDESLPGLPASMIRNQRSKMPTLDVVHLNVTIAGSLVRRIKAETGATVDEAVMAVLWRCRTRAAMSPPSQGDSDPELPALLAFACNMRAYAGAKDGYYGNCVASQIVSATMGAVAASSIGDLVRLIRRGKANVPNILSGGSSTGSGVAREQPQPQPQPQPQVGWYNTFLVVSWRNLGFDTVDLGGGAGPARVMRRFPERNVLPACMLCPPCTPDGGVRVSSMFVKPEHVDTFLGELESLATST